MCIRILFVFCISMCIYLLITIIYLYLPNIIKIINIIKYTIGTHGVTWIAV